MLKVDIEKKLELFTLKVRLELDKGICSIMGASGAGKSMCLKCIAGIEKPDSGIIILNDHVLFDSEKGINLPPQQRKTGYLFQNYALFPNMTVQKNIMTGLHSLKKAERKITADELMKEFHIEHLSDKYPEKLSGGEMQRVALARIFASKPNVLLLDEPFSSLDTFLKWELIPKLKSALKEFNGLSIMVSHDIDEILKLSDCVSEIKDGKNTDPVSINEYYDIIIKRYDQNDILPFIQRQQ